MGAIGRLVDLATRRYGDGAERAACDPLPGARCEPRDGTGRARRSDPVPGASRWPAGNRRAWTDVDAEGNGTVAEQRTYQLIRQPAAITERVFEIEFLEPGVELFCFTFG